jgi:kumamolisin
MESHVVLPGSRRPLKQDVTLHNQIDPAVRIEVTVKLKGPDVPEPVPGKTMTRQEFAAQFAADDATVEKVTSELKKHGLVIEASSPETRSLRVSGTVAQMEEVFRAGLGIYFSPTQGLFRGREGDLQIPKVLDGLVTGVFGLDQRRVAHRNLPIGERRLSHPVSVGDLNGHYDFPAGDGAGQTVAIAEFGGAYFESDLQAYCAKQGVAEPTVTAVSVNGTPILSLADLQQMPQNQQEEALNDSIEVNMDVQIVAGLCPGATIVVYFPSFDQKGWVDLLDDVVAGRPAGAVCVSVSWGMAEDDPNWSQGALMAINDALQAAANLGITVCVAAGDDGSGDQDTDGRAHVDFPGSSPYSLSVGGTMIVDSEEVVWWESPGQRTPKGGGSTGGGVSVNFPRPAWQQAIDIASINPGSISGRVVPDVAALAGPPLYDLIFLGKDSPNGGTSAATPTWAALVARMAGAGQWQPSFLSPLLYEGSPGGGTVGSTGCVDITSGNNKSPRPGGGYDAGAGFDAVSGWGVPNGAALMQALATASPTHRMTHAP